MGEKSFRSFLEEQEEKHPYLSSLEDELGINPKDLEKEPQIASFFAFGDNATNIGSYMIVKFKRNDDGQITHAVVKKIEDPVIHSKKYKDKDGDLIRKDSSDDEQKFIVKIEDLDKLMSQDFQPPPATPEGIV